MCNEGECVTAAGTDMKQDGEAGVEMKIQKNLKSETLRNPDSAWIRSTGIEICADFVCS